MTDPNHLYTVHDTFTGTGCAMCGLAPCEHTSFDWLINGVRREDPLERRTSFSGADFFLPVVIQGTK